ncbi:MAG TPA: DUF1573 domain-containing protein [Candidatus Baltobacteraceae bacterium]|nr:DUF1573 domain-containing protein [Candidatus Baltobacteraceae bacterium]
MKLCRILFALAGFIFTATGIVAADNASTNSPVTTAPVYVPDTTHENDALPDGIFAWNTLMATTNVTTDQDKVFFSFSFTNVSPDKVAIVRVQPSCGCTTADLPPLPWVIAKGAGGTIPVTMDVAGKQGVLFKSINIVTDKGSKDVYLRVTVDPAPMAKITDEDRERFVKMSRTDRQAIFKGDCADCHVKHGEGKYGMALYQADCAICHEATPRATMVPDLSKLKIPTNPDFWKQWIAHGKPGSLMGAFSQAEGGPLNDMQIASLVAYLNLVYPSKVPSAE